MSDSVYSYNLLPNPKPTDTSAWKFYSQKDLRVQIIGTGGVSLAALPAGRPAQRKQLLRFTAPADGNLQIRFRGPRGDGDTPGQLAVYEPQLELAETYDSRGTTPAYFNGDTYPIAGGLSFLAVYPRHLELEVVA